MKIVKGLQLKRKVPTLHVYVCCIILGLNSNTGSAYQYKASPLTPGYIQSQMFYFRGKRGALVRVQLSGLYNTNMRFCVES